MGSTNDILRVLAAAVVISTLAELGAPPPARAQDAADLSCSELWYRRNAIYARKGHCFNTERGRATFGEGCFPPYGRLSSSESRRVQNLQSWERRKGC